MSRSLVCLGLSALIFALPASAQAPKDEYAYEEEIPKKGEWHLSLNGMPTTFECDVKGFTNGLPIMVNSERDLALGKGKLTPGVSFEYQGPRMGFYVGIRNQKHEGDNILKYPIQIGGQEFSIGIPVKSELKTTTYDINMTVRLLTSDYGWLGLDLGAHVWRLEFQASSSLVNNNQVYKQLLPTVPAPQFGISGGTSLLENRFQARAQFHFLGFKGAKYRRIQADVRYFPLDWVGVRLFTDNEHVDLPFGSIFDDLEILADSKGVGFGVVFKF